MRSEFRADPTSSSQARDQGDDKEDEEDDEENLGDGRRARRDSAQAEDSGDDRDDEEDGSPVKHVSLLVMRFNTVVVWGGVAGAARRQRRPRIMEKIFNATTPATADTAIVVSGR